jgi:hypothetical protein
MSKDGIKEFDQTVKRRRTAFANWRHTQIEMKPKQKFTI